MPYDAGELSPDEVTALFQAFVDTDLVWQLQGLYTVTACALIDAGLVSI